MPEISKYVNKHCTNLQSSDLVWFEVKVVLYHLLINGSYVNRRVLTNPCNQLTDWLTDWLTD